MLDKTKVAQTSSFAKADKQGQDFIISLLSKWALLIYGKTQPH